MTLTLTLLLLMLLSSVSFAAGPQLADSETPKPDPVLSFGAANSLPQKAVDNGDKKGNGKEKNEEEEKILVFIDGFEIAFDVQPVMEHGRLLVPLRTIFEKLQATVQWEAKTKTVKAAQRGHILELTVDQKEARINGEEHLLDVPARVIEGRTMVPLRFISEFWDLRVDWINKEKTAYLSTGLARYSYFERKFPSLHNSQELNNNANNLKNNNFVVGVHLVELSPSLQLKVSLAQGLVGRATSLQNFASYFSDPVAIINGTYFNAGGKNPDPYGTIITNGEIVHTGSEGTTIGFTASKEIKVDSLTAEIKGRLWGYNFPEHRWSAYGLNHTPSPDTAAVYLFTRARGSSIGFSYGTSVIVDRKGKIIDRVKNTDAPIPYGGFVLNFTGYRELEALRFIPGMEVEYEIVLRNQQGEVVDWSEIKEAFTCWPLLVQEGQIVAPVSQVPAVRSVMAIRPNGQILLLNSTPATLEQLAAILQKDLAVQFAINLDGGGSSGLYFHGTCITKPGRLLANALVFHQ